MRTPQYYRSQYSVPTDFRYIIDQKAKRKQKRNQTILATLAIIVFAVSYVIAGTMDAQALIIAR